MTSVPPAMQVEAAPTDALSYRLIIVLAFVAGYVDAFGFVALFGLFTAHVTANFVLASANAVGYGQDPLIKLCALPAFVVGVAMAKLVVIFHTRRGTNPERSIYVIEAICLCGLMMIGAAASPLRAVDAKATLVCGLLGAMAMGMQTAHGQLVLHGHAPTTLMTQNLTQAVINAIEAVFAQSSAARHQSTSRFWDTTCPVLGFSVGALLGAISWVHASFFALLFPVALLSILALRAGTGPCAVGE